MNIKRLIYLMVLLIPLASGGGSLYAQENQVKQFDKQRIEELKQSGDFDYVEAKPANTSLLQRFLRFLNNLITRFFTAATDTALGRVLLYIALFILLMVALIKIFSLNVNDVFYGASDKGELSFEIMEEDIDTLDLEALLQKAVAQASLIKTGLHNRKEEHA